MPQQQQQQQPKNNNITDNSYDTNNNKNNNNNKKKQLRPSILKQLRQQKQHNEQTCAHTHTHTTLKISNTPTAAIYEAIIYYLCSKTS